MKKRKTPQIDRGILSLFDGISFLFVSNNHEYYHLKVSDNLFIIISFDLNNGYADLFAVSGIKNEFELKDLIKDDEYWTKHFCVKAFDLDLMRYQTDSKIFSILTNLNGFIMKNKNSPVSSADLANVLEL